MKKVTTILIFYSWLAMINVAKSQGIEITNTASIQAVGSATIEITNGRFINNGTYTMGTENLIFSGSTLGSISGSSNNDLYHLTVNNSNGVTHQSTGYVAVNNLLTFSLGLFNTGSNQLIINDNATYGGASTTKYINGNCKKVGNDAFVFPIGNTGKYAPTGITAPLAVTDAFTATYFNSNPNPFYDVSLKDTTINHVSTVEYWVLDRTAGVSNVNVSLFWDTASAVNNLVDLRVVRWNGLKWVDEGNSSVTGNTSLGTVTSNVVTSFSPFTLGSVSVDNPLPVELLCFESTCKNSKTIINWSTASETNCDYFVVEKMTGGDTDFRAFANVSGSGNSSQVVTYQVEDENIYAITYYRLIQVDYNGNTKVYNQNITYSNCNESTNQIEITLYESLENIYATYLFGEDAIFEIKIFGLSGNLILNKTQLFTSGTNQISSNELNLASGMYMVNFKNDKMNKSIKMIVK